MPSLKTFMAKISFAAAGLAAGGLALAVLSNAPASKADDAKPAAQSHVTPRCLDTRNFGRIHVLGQNSLIVYDEFENPYKLELGGPCKSMVDTSRIGFELSGTDQLCHAHDAMLLYFSDESLNHPARCLINSIKPLTKDEAKALDKD